MYHGCHAPPQHPHPAAQPGLVAVFGGVINLATTALYGGARVLRTIVEGSVWHGVDHHGPGDCRSHGHHCHAHCVPETYHCCRCCER